MTAPASDRAFTIYVAGPMRGKPRYNFDAFDAAYRSLREHFPGAVVITPADMDRMIGFDPEKTLEENGFDVRAAVDRDLAVVTSEGCDAVAVLHGWERSIGARAEVFVALWLGKRVFLASDPTRELDVSTLHTVCRFWRSSSAEV